MTNRSNETILEPELAIVDAHHHLWVHPGDHKESGFGAEGGVAGLEDYISSTAVQYLV